MIGKGIRRAAFDIGSGATKLLIADIDIEKNIIQNVLFGGEIPCAFGADFVKSSDGFLSETIQIDGLSILRELRGLAVNLGTSSYSAIATEVFRKAKNGPSYIAKVRDEFNMEIEIISQNDEAQLGFLTGYALMKSRNPNFSSNKFVVWDSGGGSFQITTNCGMSLVESISDVDTETLESYVGSIGSVVSMKMLVESIQHLRIADVTTPNPVSREESDAFISFLLQTLPQEVPKWLRNPETVIAIGGPNSLFYLAKTIIISLPKNSNENDITGENRICEDRNQDILTIQDVRRALDLCIGRDDESLKTYMSHPHPDPPSLIVPKLSLLLAVMMHTGMKEVEFVEAVGSCAGMLMKNSYWKKEIV